MQNSHKDHIELKQRRDIGDVVTTYFEFYKRTLKSFLNIFITYNGLFILGFLIVSYLMVTGFVGSIRATPDINGVVDTDTYDTYLIFGLIGFLLIFIVTAIMNYSLAASYMVNYERNGTHEVDRKDVIALIMKHLGNIIIFVILLFLIYIGVLILGIIVSFIPVLGTFAYYGMMAGFTSWMGLSFMAMIHKEMGVTESFSEGWKLMVKHFWKCVLVNVIIGILIACLLILILTVPGVIIGIYAFHSLETGVDLANSPVATVVWTIALTIFLVVSSYNQSLSQFSNGILYYSLYEETYNEHTRKMIDQIGASEEV